MSDNRDDRRGGGLNDIGMDQSAPANSPPGSPPRGDQNRGRGDDSGSDAHNANSPKGSDKSPSQSERREGDREEKKDDRPSALSKSEKVSKSKSSGMMRAGYNAVTERSNLLTMNDRHQLEQEFMKQFDGTQIKELKKNVIIGYNDKKDIKEGTKLIDRLREDGIYVDGSLEQKIEDPNIKKIEERLLNCR